MKPSVVMPSSIGSSVRPTLRIWKKWSMTQIESNPASSAVRTGSQSGRDGGRAAGPREGRDLEADLLPEEVVGGGHDDVGDAAVAAGERRSPDDRHGPCGGLAEGQFGGRRELVCDGPNGRAHDPAVRVLCAAQVVEGQQPGHADRDIGDAPAPRPAERIGHDDRDVDAEPGADCGPDAAGGGIGVAWQERDERARTGPDVRGVHASVGAHEAMGGLGDEDAVRHPDDPSRLAQDDLHLAWVTVELRGEVQGLLARVNAGQVDDRALRLGDDLLGDDEDVVEAERERARSALDRVADQRPKVVPETDLRDALQREDGDGAGVGRGGHAGRGLRGRRGPPVDRGGRVGRGGRGGRVSGHRSPRERPTR